MKKMFLVAAATIIATASFSQVRFGIQAIGNANTVGLKMPESEDFKKPSKIGFGGGIVADIPVGTNVSIRPSLNYLQKKSGAEFQIPLIPGKVHTINNTLHYLELPVNVVYTIPMNNVNLYFGAGPSFGYGLSGKSIYKGWDNEGEGQNFVAVEEKYDVYKKDEDGSALKRFEISANANAGLQFNNGMFINAGYMLGLNNLGDKDGSYKNRGVLLTLGFLLPGKR